MGYQKADGTSFEKIKTFYKVKWQEFKQNKTKKRVVVVLLALILVSLIFIIPPVTHGLLKIISLVKTKPVSNAWIEEIRLAVGLFILLAIILSKIIIFFTTEVVNFIKRNRFFLCLFVLLMIKQNYLVFSVMHADVSKSSFFDLIYRFATTNYLLWLAPMALYFSASFLFKHKNRYYTIVYIILTCVIFTYTVYYRGFNTFPALENLLSSGNNVETIGFKSLLLPARAIDFWLLLDIPLLVAFVIWRKHYWQATTKRSFVGFAIALVYACVSIYYVSTMSNRNYVMFARQNSSFSVTLGHELSSVRNKRKLTPEEYAQLQAFFESNQDNNLSSYDGLFEGQNVLFIIAESLESWAIGLTYEGVEITPTANKLLEHAYYFPNIYEQTGSGGSSDGSMLYLVGIYPLSSGSAALLFPNYTTMSTARWLENIGYGTRVMTPDQPVMWNRRLVLEHYGFQSTHHYGYQMEEVTEVDQRSAFGFSDYGLFNLAGPMIAKDFKENAPFFDLLISVDAHAPYERAKTFKKIDFQFSDETPEALDGYLRASLSTDLNLADVFDELEKNGVLDNTVIVIAGDHTGLSKYYAGNYPEPVGYLGIEKRVPLIIYSKRIKEGKQFDTIGGQIDLSPTLLSLLGVSANDYKKAIMGKNLMAFAEREETGYVLLPDGTIKGSTTNQAYLEDAHYWSSLMIRSNTSSVNLEDK